jgi:hypothetical protein
MRSRTVWATAALTLLALAGCYQKGTLEGSRVEVVRVEGRRFEVRIVPTEAPNEYRMLIVRATMVINADPELEMARAREVAQRYMNQTCRGQPHKEVVSGLEGQVNYRVVFRCL